MEDGERPVVRFAFGDRPAIDDAGARDLVDALMSFRDAQASNTAGKIQTELAKPTDERRDVELNDRELAKLVELLSAGLPARRPDLVHLLGQAKQELARRMGTSGASVPKPPENDRK